MESLRRGRTGYIVENHLDDRARQVIRARVTLCWHAQEQVSAGEGEDDVRPQAARNAGSWLALPIASNIPAVTQYTIATPRAMATPARAPPRRLCAEKGIASTP